jgi:hypothetical protein
MAGFKIQREEAGDTVMLRLEGTFNGQAALVLRGELEQLGDQHVVIDFSRVNQFLDLAVPILTRGLNHPSLRLRGLAKHHERVFRYFGVFDPRQVSQGEYWTPEDALAM